MAHGKKGNLHRLADHERLTVVAGQELVGLGVVDELLGLRVEAELRAKLIGGLLQVHAQHALELLLDRLDAGRDVLVLAEGIVLLPERHFWPRR